MVNLELERLTTETALGLKWNIEEDKFVWEVLEKILKQENKKPVTRRGIVFAVYSLFNPLGLITLYVMKAKLLLQTFSRKKLSWDDPLEEANNGQWKRWLDDLPKLQEIQVNPRDLVMLKKYSCTSSQTLPGKDMQLLHTSA